MKRILSYFGCLCVAVSAWATGTTSDECPRSTECNGSDIQLTADQEIKPVYRNIYGELFGASNLIGVHYDQRFRPGSKWGFRAGIGYSLNVNIAMALYNGGGYNTISAPFAVNGIFGKRHSYFEAGFGVSPGIAVSYHGGGTYYYYDREGALVSQKYKSTTNTAFSFKTFFDFGYRYQKPKGFMFRVGITPAVSWYRDMCVLTISPYVSFGYTFK